MSNRQALTRVALDRAIGLLSLIVALVSVDCTAAPVYVANGSHTALLARVNSTDGSIIGTALSLRAVPASVEVSPSGDRVYVVHRTTTSDPSTAGWVSVVSVPDWRVIWTIQVGAQAAGAVLSHNGGSLFVVSAQIPMLWAIDTSTLSVRTLGLGAGAFGIALDPSGTLLYIGTTAGVQVVSPATLAQLHTIPLDAPGESFARFVAVSPDGHYVYVTERTLSITEGNVVFLNATTREVVRRIAIDGVPETLALSHDGQRLYVGLRSGANSVAVISTEEMRVLSYVPLGSIVNGLALTVDDRELWVMLDDTRVVAVDTQALAVTKSVSGLAGAASRGNFIGPRVTPPGTGPVVEFYHHDLDHYFVTQDPGEIRALDQGTQPGWARTGQSFFAFPVASATSGQPVCRYYGLPAAGLNSHFYSASANECAQVAASFPGAWLLEASDVFRIAVPSSVGDCPAGTEPVYRLWNNRRDSNHRYTMNAGIREAMVAKGYVSEGYGPLGVAMCGTAAQ